MKRAIMCKSVFRFAVKNPTPTTPTLSPDVRAALTAEANQAWEHYRHVENQRNSYIGFFLTAVLGFIALIGTISAIVKSSYVGWPLISLGIAADFFSCLSIGIFLAIRRFDSVLNLYAQIILETRDTIFSDAPEEIRTSLHRLSIYGREPLYPYDEQMIVETSFAVLAGIFTSCSTAISILALTITGFTLPQQTVAASVALFGVSIFVVFLILFRRIKRIPIPDLKAIH
jgi:hypothetical protein